MADTATVGSGTADTTADTVTADTVTADTVTDGAVTPMAILCSISFSVSTLALLISISVSTTALLNIVLNVGFCLGHQYSSAMLSTSTAASTALLCYDRHQLSDDPYIVLHALCLGATVIVQRRFD